MANPVTSGVRGILKEFDITWKVLAVVAGAAAIVGGLLLWSFLADRQYVLTGPGQVRGAHLITFDNRSILVISEDVAGDESNHRLEAIDADTGHPLARTRTTGHVDCVPATGGLVWCNTNYGNNADLELRDAVTLDVRVSHAKLLAAAPALAANKRPSIDARTGEAWMMTTDGRFWHVDPRTLQAGVEAEDHDLPQGAAVDIGSGSSPLSSSLTSAQPTSYQFVGSPRATMQISDGHGGSHAIGTETFLHPEFIVEKAGPSQPYSAALAFDHGVLLVVHHQTVDDSSPLLVTAMGLDGARRWTTTLAHGEVRGAWIVNHHLVLAVHAEKQGSVVALDEHDGHVIWQAGT